MADAETSPLCEQILQSFTSLVSSVRFKEQLVAERKVVSDDLIVVNNSFVERQGMGIKTTKNSQYLCVRQGRLDDLSADALGVCTPSTFNVSFKRYSAKSANFPHLVSLGEAVRLGVRKAGRLISLLIGVVDDTVEVAVPLSGPMFSELRLVPTNAELVVIRDEVVEVNEVKDPDAIWSALEAAAVKQGVVESQIPPELASKLTAALIVLRSRMHSLVHLPEGELEVAGGTLLRRMIDSLSGEVEAYDAAIDRCGGDPARDAQSFADVLRIAYNFASDSQKIITLIVGLCDLKPLLLWATVAENFRLACSFQDLPWAKSGGKSSPGEFHTMVSGARNHAFHNLIRIDRAMRVQVESVTLQARSLTLFAPYNKKVGNTLTYEDQELVEILTQFTHAPETVVPAQFWVRSSAVMHALADLLVSLERALFLMHNEQVLATASRPS